MDFISILQAAFLGLIEGVTEFLPVSSTGHLILAIDLLGFQEPPGKLFEIVIQLGAILSVCWVYRVKLIEVLVGLMPTGDKDSQVRAWLFTRNILLAFVPSMVVGALAYGFIKRVLFSPWVVSVALIVGGVILFVIDRRRHAERYNTTEEIPARGAFAIGLFQCVSMIPGVSRAGATILGAMLVGVSRPAAAEFSFLLAIPTMLAATVYDVYKNWSTLEAGSVTLIAVGFVTAFVTALPVVRLLVGFVSRHGFAPFAIYRVVVGLAMLALLIATRTS